MAWRLPVPARGARLPSLLLGLEIDLRVSRAGAETDLAVRMDLEEDGHVEVTCIECSPLAAAVDGAWREVLEVSLPFDVSGISPGDRMGLVLRIGRDGMTEHVFHSAGLASLGWGVA